jgi:alpha-amylase/alpha-mannosidase (GH57 family)
VLIEQLEDLAQAVSGYLSDGRALPDAVLGLLAPEPLTQDPTLRLAGLRACLRAQRQHMIERFPPYLELVTVAETLATPQRIRYASDQLIQDLAVWYHIAWLGETVRRDNPAIAALMEQAHGFTQAQRRDLLALIGRLLSSIVPRFRALAERGQCELSMTPYSHPLMPLLLDFGSAREALSQLELPRHVAYPGGTPRSAWHIEEGVRVFVRAFGQRPVGCWPAEGAVSRATLPLLEEAGFRWTASSSNVLRNSLASAATPAAESALNRAYRMSGSPLTMLFRHDELSDLIGFTYASWHGDDAAAHFAGELAHLAERLPDRTEHVVLVALDGENAWEHYPFNGYYFLRALYAALTQHPLLELTTIADCLPHMPAPASLPNVVAGSWVHGSFATWIGEEQKNRAWDLLCEAKLAFDQVMRTGGLDEVRRRAAERQLALCESSDWFWWFGDYNPADAVLQFDGLYRRQLTNLYRLLGLAPAPELARPISTGGGHAEHGGVMRRASAG